MKNFALHFYLMGGWAVPTLLMVQKEYTRISFSLKDERSNSLPCCRDV